MASPKKSKASPDKSKASPKRGRGRPRMYFTEQQKLEANRSKSLRHWRRTHGIKKEGIDTVSSTTTSIEPQTTQHTSAPSAIASLDEHLGRDNAFLESLFTQAIGAPATPSPKSKGKGKQRAVPSDQPFTPLPHSPVQLRRSPRSHSTAGASRYYPTQSSDAESLFDPFTESPPLPSSPITTSLFDDEMILVKSPPSSMMELDFDILSDFGELTDNMAQHKLEEEHAPGSSTQHQNNDRIAGGSEHVPSATVATTSTPSSHDDSARQEDEPMLDVGTPEVRRMVAVSIPFKPITDVTMPAPVSSDDESEFEELGGEDSDFEVVGRAAPRRTDNDDAPAINMARELVAQLDSFHGCDGQEHACSAAHSRAQDTGHADDPDPPRHMSLHDLARHHDILPDTISAAHLIKEEEAEGITAETLRAVCEGTSSHTEKQPPEVCLKCSDGEGQEHVETLFDVDSIFGFARCLSFARYGIDLNMAPTILGNITSDLRVKLDCIDQETKVRDHRPLHNIPHIQLGRLIGMEPMSIYLFFPRMYQADANTNFLTDENLAQWIDNFFRPAIRKHFTRSFTSHYPSSYKQALRKSRAAFRTSRVNNANPETKRKQLYHILPADGLHELWQDIQRRVAASDIEMFKDVKIMFNILNQKLAYKRHAFKNAWQAFTARWESVIDSHHLDKDRTWVDIAKESCPIALYSTDGHDDDGPTHVLLWRPCCILAYTQWLQRIRGTRKSIGKQTYFNNALLRDASGLSVVFAPGTNMHVQGLIYCQLYTGSKEVFGMSGTRYPFDEDVLENLALDENLAAGIRQAGRATTFNEEAVFEYYNINKQNISIDIDAGENESYSVREEYRVTMTLAERMYQVELAKPAIVQTNNSRPTPQRFFRVLSKDYFDVVRANINKFTTCFEYIHHKGKSAGLVTGNYMQMMTMFLRLMKYTCVSLNLRRDSALWKDEWVHKPTNARRYGVGIGDTLQRYGYAWLKPKFDWERMAYRCENAGTNALETPTIVSNYRARKRHVKSLVEDSSLADKVLEWLQRSRDRIPATTEAITSLVWICLRQFRKCVFKSIERRIQPEHRQRALAGEITLCKANVEEIMIPVENVTSCSTAQGDQLVHETLEEFISFLWDEGGSSARLHWKDMGYRVIYRQCITALSLQGGDDLAQRFVQQLKQTFVLVNWIVPYPSADSFWRYKRANGNIPSQIRWMLIYNKRLADVFADVETVTHEQIQETLENTTDEDARWIIGREVDNFFGWPPVGVPYYMRLDRDEMEARFKEFEKTNSGVHNPRCS